MTDIAAGGNAKPEFHGLPPPEGEASRVATGVEEKVESLLRA